MADAMQALHVLAEHARLRAYAWTLGRCSSAITGISVPWPMSFVPDMMITKSLDLSSVFTWNIPTLKCAESLAKGMRPTKGMCKGGIRTI